MKPFITFLIFAAFTSMAAAQPAPGGAGATPAVAKPKPYSPGDTRVYVTIAACMQFHLGMSMHLLGKYGQSDPGMAAFADKLHKACTDLWTPGVDAAMRHGVEGKKFPREMSKNDQAALARIDNIKDDRKWQLAFFDFYAREARKNARDAEGAARSAEDPDLKEFSGKAVALLKADSDEIEAKLKELKAKK